MDTERKIEYVETLYLNHWSGLHFLAGVMSGLLFPQLEIADYIAGHIIWQMLARTEQWKWKGLIGDVVLGTSGFFLVKNGFKLLLK
jgi:hypothetical protein